MTARRHVLVRWLVAQYGTELTPLGDFSRALNRSAEFPVEGDHDKLREFVQLSSDDDAWQIACFDVAWNEWLARTCGMAECTARPVGESLLCPKHELAVLL